MKRFTATAPQDLQHPVDQKQKALPSPSQSLADRRHQDAWAHAKKLRYPPNPAETRWWTVPLCEETGGQVLFSIHLVAVKS